MRLCRFEQFHTFAPHSLLSETIFVMVGWPGVTWSTKPKSATLREAVIATLSIKVNYILEKKGKGDKSKTLSGSHFAGGRGAKQKQVILKLLSFRMEMKTVWSKLRGKLTHIFAIK